LFSDEIGDIPLSTQVKLLRGITRKENRRIGAEQTIKMMYGLVAATNCQLGKIDF